MGSEMCIRDSYKEPGLFPPIGKGIVIIRFLINNRIEDFRQGQFWRKSVAFDWAGAGLNQPQEQGEVVAAIYHLAFKNNV